MPNWVYNEVEIAAPLSEVQAYLFETDDPEYQGQRTHFFNLHRLFPERYQADDEQGLKAWDYDWMYDNIGTKWNPKIEFIDGDEHATKLDFESAWSPPLDLLEYWHKLTGWTIHSEFEEEQPEFEGTFHCE